MKRAGNLFPQVVSWENLELAARKARTGKRLRISTEDFELRRETRLMAIREALLDGSWKPGAFRQFTIRDPKERLISAPPYEDRVVHHALCNVIQPVLERSWIHHSYSCRVGKGTGAARAQCRKWARGFSHVLKVDVRKFFLAVDHDLLLEKIARQIKCGPTLALCERIIRAGPGADGSVHFSFPGDDLFTPGTRGCGLPVGSLTSQIFANHFLTRADHFIEETLSPGAYLRYTDDLVLFSNAKTELHDMKARLETEFHRDRLRMHPRKSRVHAVIEGIPFLGFRFYPKQVRVLRANRLRFEQRLRRLGRAYRAGHAPGESLWPAMFAWFQFVREFPGMEGLVHSECGAHSFRGRGGSSEMPATTV